MENYTISTTALEEPRSVGNDFPSLSFTTVSSATSHSHSHSHVATSTTTAHIHSLFPISTYITAIVQYLNKSVFLYGPFYNSVIAAVLVHTTSFLVVSLLPLNIQHSGKGLRIKLLLGFALGTVLGEVFLHLIPEADPTYLGTGLFAGLLTFLFIEKFLKIVTPQDEHSHHHHTHPHTTTKTGKPTAKANGPPAYLTIITSLLHNTTDGITLATAFFHSASTGTITTLAFLVHEFPHLLSDYIIILNSTNRNKRPLLRLCRNTLTAIIGASIGVTLFYMTTTTSTKTDHIQIPLSFFGHEAPLEALLLPFSAGGLLYMCSVNLLPEILGDGDGDGDEDRDTVLGLMMQFVASCFGFYVMYLLAE